VAVDRFSVLAGLLCVLVVADCCLVVLPEVVLFTGVPLVVVPDCLVPEFSVLFVVVSLVVPVVVALLPDPLVVVCLD
jgi:hypothetical protein